MSITEFLLSRIAEDEQAAVAVRWKDELGEWGYEPHSADDEELLINRYSPFRVLRECEAKRQILNAHRPLRDVEPVEDLTYPEAADTCVACCAGDHWSVRELDSKWLNGWCSTKAILAAIYSDHPDYRDEWRQ